MFARARGRHGRLKVRTAGSGDADNVDVRSAEHRFEAARGERCTVLCGKGVRLVLGAATHTAERAARDASDRLRVKVRDQTKPDDAETERRERV